MTFRKFSNLVSHLMGQPLAFVLAFLVCLGWFIGGLFMGFGDVYQLVINTSTTIITFLMVFLIQNTQNRDILSIQLKLDELIESSPAAKNDLLEAEDLSEGDMAKKQKEYRTFLNNERNQNSRNQAQAWPEILKPENEKRK